MTVDPALSDYHKEQSEKAREHYLASRTPDIEAEEWHALKAQGRKLILHTLRATSLLTDIETPLIDSAEHIFVLRRLLAPPLSQDQFALRCDAYSKSQENNGRPVSNAKAAEISSAFSSLRDKRLTRWLDQNRKPTLREVRSLVDEISILITSQSAATLRRTLLAAKQEKSVIDLLSSQAWVQKSAPLIEQASQLGLREFMHKTRFSTQTSPQEVDIACGLGRSVILAMECKVTNDATNSVKRVNDVLKKARAWQTHWGNFVKTAALLEGVIAHKDVYRLLDENVEVFWSHKLDDLLSWLNDNIEDED